jgi:hypothetical protein
MCEKQINTRRIDNAIARSEGAGNVVKSNRENRKDYRNVKGIVGIVYGLANPIAIEL